MYTRWCIALVLLAVIASGCGGGTAEYKAGREEPITIIGKDNSFEPATAQIKARREYEFVLKNQGTAVHKACTLCSARIIPR